ncbi:acyltransferase ChoActase/COT/CPT [Zychaea mexicana]|uniref:acyltransferase ChoActase/COT/CPT n=1 Tax=Zychaea mexicana TaxID=64656 RepID=UPI0022FEAD18|nr:acyltransferase ChoActase/COT/CPT [Zychaea mexicana]KAI9495160.1 acyltransferase ChoActase/COT/CPT [Zychaea mexicana]
MLRYQSNLPRLPVPKFEETLAKYLNTVKPLLSEAEYQKTEASVKEFVSSGMAEKLQQRLVAKANDPNVLNWLDDWWLDAAYLGYRDPVVIYVSYFYLYKDDKLRRLPAQRAAAVTTAALEFKKQVVENTLEPEYAKGEPLCMDRYKYMFSNCRIPKKPADENAMYDPAKNTHILVIRKNKFYVVDTVHNGRQLTTGELEYQFQRVYDAAGFTKGVGFGALTADNRDNWADNRELLLAAHPENKNLLEKIESASFVVCLDDYSPVTRDESCRACWHGDGRNRFFDKPCQFIIYENGKAGFMGEHAMMDGTATCRLNEYVCDAVAKAQPASVQANTTLPAPSELQFQINSQVDQAVRAAEARFDQLIANHDLTVLAFQGFGKNLIKKFKTSPDGFVQMVIQLGYYKMFGTCRPTYESAQTRKFQLGRTETSRTVSQDSLDFARIMESNAPNEQKIAAFRKAIKTQGAYMGQCVNAHGVDRHLFGLKKSLNADEAVPAIFTDPTYAYSSHWYLSTSQLSSEYFDGYGWGQVVNDGFGVAYMIKNNGLSFNVASVKDLEIDGKKYVNGTHHFKQCLEDAANELGELLSTEIKPQAKL